MVDNEDILRDVREEEKWLQITDMTEWKNNPSSRASVYNNREKKSIDAERWSLAISSYKKYGCFVFLEDDADTKGIETQGKFYYSTKDCYIHYVNEDGEDIRIPADLLTNYGTIHELIDKYNPETDEEKKLVKAFDRVAYTIGAFCPIWKNPGGYKAWNDTVWDKLLNSGLVDSEGKVIGSCICLEERDNEDDIRRRRKENLFLIIPKNTNPQSVVASLYFQDYFSSKWELKCKIGNINELRNRDEVYNYIKDIIVLIVQRSYRIITNYQGNILRKNDKDIIKEALNSIGMNNVECIYSKKRNDIVKDDEKKVNSRLYI